MNTPDTWLTLTLARIKAEKNNPTPTGAPYNAAL